MIKALCNLAFFGSLRLCELLPEKARTIDPRFDIMRRDIIIKSRKVGGIKRQFLELNLKCPKESRTNKEGIKIEVFDEDIGKDDKLGHKILKMEEIIRMESLVDQWVVLEGCKSGEILLSIELIRMKANEQDTINIAEGEIVHDKMSVPDMKKEVLEIPIASDKTYIKTEEIPYEEVPKRFESTDKVLGVEQTLDVDVKSTTPLVTLPSKTLDTSDSEKVTLTSVKSINIMVHKAKDLEKKGFIGKADPYVKVTVGEKTVKNNQSIAIG